MDILSISTWALSHLRSYQLSFRRTDRALKRIVGSIRVYGSRIPLLVTRAEQIIRPRSRTKTARALGFTQLPAHSTPRLVELLRRPILKQEVHSAAA